MQAMPREQLTALQEEGLKYRFESLVDKVPMLEKLASKQGINKLDSIEDVCAAAIRAHHVQVVSAVLARTKPLH